MDGGLSFFAVLSWQAISPIEFVSKNWSIRLLHSCVLCRYSKRYLFRKSKAPAVSPPKLPYPWKCPQPPIKFLPRLPISTFSLCCDTHGSRAPILKDQAQTTLPKMKMLVFSIFTMSSIIFPQTFRLLPTFAVSVAFSGLFLTKVGGGRPNAQS